MTAVFAATYNVVMLKIFVISLFVANILLLGFQASKPPKKKQLASSAPKTLDSSVPTIHLFSELMENRDLMSGNRQCFTLGPFHSEDEMDAVLTRLLPVSVEVKQRETQAMVEKGYWVFMPPYASLLQANEELLSLQSLGLVDIGVVYDGGLKNAISLGYFLRQENALKRKKSLESRGYSAVMRVQRQTEPRYWLDYEQDPGSGLVNLDMQSRPNDFMQRASPCADSPVLKANVVNVESLDTGEDDVQTGTVEESDVLEAEKG